MLESPRATVHALQAEGATAAALQASQEQSRQLRLHLRSSRDEARPVRLLHVMLAGEKFAELDEDGRAHNVWLEISPDQLRLRAFKTKTASEASESPLYELELSALRKISFGQSAHPAARSMQVRAIPDRQLRARVCMLQGVGLGRVWWVWRRGGGIVSASCRCRCPPPPLSLDSPALHLTAEVQLSPLRTFAVHTDAVALLRCGRWLGRPRRQRCAGAGRPLLRGAA